MIQDALLSEENWNYLLEYLEKIDASFFELNIKKDATQNDKIIGNLMALQEEVGEFTSEIRKLTKMMFSQRKIESFKIEDLEDEATDVLITLILVLKSCWIQNLDAAIARKIEKNKARWY